MNLKAYAWEIKLSIFLIIATILIYVAKIAIIGDDGESNTLTYIFNALGFLPVNVLLVTLILNTLLTRRAKKEQQEKMKMIVGLFFSELGNTLLHLFVKSDTQVELIRNKLAVQMTWKSAEYQEAYAFLDSYKAKLAPSPEELVSIKTTLVSHHDFLLGLVENPIFLEGEKVANLMQALFHLSEELCDRCELCSLPKPDMHHLAGDVNRVYGPLAELWVSHMEYLSAHYPYLLSLNLRKSPFKEQPDVIVKE
ncbi:MAG TPA: hypothetical protein O0X27_04230 [Methanocorpusculum sp.]|nr:hypothetical protein [Methanocorpusculum sp.]